LFNFIVEEFNHFFQYILDNMLVNELSDEECSYLFECDEVIRFQSQRSEENGFTSKKYIALVERNVTKSEQILQNLANTSNN
jgi:hypothetical protein